MGYEDGPGLTREERRGLRPIYNGVKKPDEVTLLEEKISILNNHLFRDIDVTVFRERDYLVVEARDWGDTIFQSKGSDNTERNLIVRPYISGATLEIAVSINEDRYLLRTRSSDPTGSNPCG